MTKLSDKYDKYLFEAANEIIQERQRIDKMDGEVTESYPYVMEFFLSILQRDAAVTMEGIEGAIKRAPYLTHHFDKQYLINEQKLKEYKA